VDGLVLMKLFNTLKIRRGPTSEPTHFGGLVYGKNSWKNQRGTGDFGLGPATQ
jgi:hypothetical protein